MGLFSAISGGVARINFRTTNAKFRRAFVARIRP